MCLLSFPHYNVSSMRAGILDRLGPHCISSTRTMPAIYNRHTTRVCWMTQWGAPVRYFDPQLTVYMHLVLRKFYKAVKCNQSVQKESRLFWFQISKMTLLHSPGGLVAKNPPANAGDTGSIPGPWRSHMCHQVATPTATEAWALESPCSVKKKSVQWEVWAAPQRVGPTLCN